MCICSVYECGCVYIDMYACVCIVWMCVYKHVHMCICSVYECGCVYIDISACVCRVWMCVYNHVHMCICSVYECGCVFEADLLVLDNHSVCSSPGKMVSPT